MTLQLQTSIAGGPWLSGVQTGSFGQSLALQAASTATLNTIRYEIYDYPVGFACPAGWSVDLTQGGTGVYYYAPSSVTTPPPAITLPASGANNWGPFMLRLRGNQNPNRLNDDGSPNQQYNPALTDESTFVLLLSPTLGLPGFGRGVTSQYDGLRLWAGLLMANLRLVDNASSGGSFSAGGDLGGSAISQIVQKVHGATVPAAGSLTTGNGLYASGASALSYSALNLAGGSGWVTGILPVANGGTGLGTVGANGTVLTVVGGVPAWAAPSGSAFVAGGDLGGTSTNQNVLAVHGATVPVAGALTIGNLLQVTGSSSLGYGPLNLAGGAGSIAGSLPAANQAPQTMGGDVTGTTAVSVVARVNGATVPSAGSLVVGALLLVSGASALSYGPLNLASSASVGGSLGVANGGTGLSSLGTADQLIGMNHAGSALAYFTAAGDVSLASGSFTVGGLQGFAIATATPTSGQVLTWNAGTSSWTATTPGSAASVTGSGIWHSASGTLGSSAYLGTAGQALFTNAGATDTAWTTFSGDIGASTSTPGAITVKGLQGHSVLTTSPTAGQFLIESAGAAGWGPVSISGDATASTTTVGQLTVTALQGFGVATSTPTSGQVLAWNSGTSKWTATTVGVSVTGSGLWHSSSGTLSGAAYLGTAGQFLLTNAGATDTSWASISADVTASTTTPGALTVVAIRGNAVSITAATAGQFLVENSGASGSAWTTISGDISASTSTVGKFTVTQIQGNPVSATAATAGQYLLENSGATGSSWVTLTGDVSSSTTTVGKHTVTGIQGNPVSATAATAGQFLVENSGATGSSWVSIAGDVSASTGIPGSFTVVALQGFGIATTTPTSGQVLTWNSGTSKWTPATPSGSSGGGQSPIDFTFGTSGASSATSIAASSKVWKVIVNVTTPFSTGAALNLGQSGNTTLLLSGLSLTTAGLFVFDLIASWGASALAVLATVTGSPSVGAAEVLIQQGPVQA